jgi:hypothetical protein
MKKVLLLALAGAFVACTTMTADPDSQDQTAAKDPLEGTWKMSAFYAVDAESGDTIFAEQRNQYKMYADNHVVWINSFEADSTDMYGMGTYEVKADTLYEHIMASAFPVRDFYAKNSDFAIHIEYTDSTYIQYIPDSTMVIIEVYNRLE